MKILTAGNPRNNAAIALSAGTAVLIGSAASASFITFDGDAFVSEATMFAEAGGMGSEIEVPTGSLTPFESYSFGPSHSHNDGIGMSTSLVSQEYEPGMDGDGAIHGFSLTGHAGGQFQVLNEGPFSGHVKSHSLFDALFSLDASSLVQINGTLSAAADSFPGSTQLLSRVRLYEIDDNGASILFEESISTAGANSIDEMLQLDMNNDYRLEVIADVNGEFDGTIAGTSVFHADFDLNFAVIPAPGTLALLALTGLIGTRGRRRE